MLRHSNFSTHGECPDHAAQSSKDNTVHLGHFNAQVCSSNNRLASFPSFDSFPLRLVLMTDRCAWPLTQVLETHPLPSVPRSALPSIRCNRRVKVKLGLE